MVSYRDVGRFPPLPWSLEADAKTSLVRVHEPLSVMDLLDSGPAPFVGVGDALKAIREGAGALVNPAPS
jgi:hypothetical protein